MSELSKIEFSLARAASRCQMTLEETAHMMCALETEKAMSLMTEFMTKMGYPTDTRVINKEIGRLVQMEK